MRIGRAITLSLTAASVMLAGTGLLRAGDDEAPENRYSDQRNADNSEQGGQRVPRDDIGQ